MNSKLEMRERFVRGMNYLAIFYYVFEQLQAAFFAGLVLLVILTKPVRCSRFMQIAMVSMEYRDSCHPTVCNFYNILRMSARITGLL